MEKQYYLYRHIREDKNEVFYIGFGTVNKNGKRESTRFSRAFYKLNRTNFWKSITNKTKYTVDVFFISENLELVLNKETEFISLYKRKYEGGTLCNFSVGGEKSALGIKPSKKTIEKRSKSLKESWTKRTLRGRVVYEYDLLGSLINVYKTVTELSKISGISGTALHRAIDSETGVYLKYKKVYSFSELSVEEVLRRASIVAPTPFRGPRIYKNIHQFDINGNLIKIWKGVGEAEKSGFNRNLIRASILGEQSHHAGYIWAIK